MRCYFCNTLYSYSVPILWFNNRRGCKVQDVSVIVPRNLAVITGYPGGHRLLCDKTAVLSDVRKTPCIIKVDQTKGYLYMLKLWVRIVKFSLQISVVCTFCCNAFHHLCIRLIFMPSGFKRKYSVEDSRHVKQFKVVKSIDTLFLFARQWPKSCFPPRLA